MISPINLKLTPIWSHFHLEWCIFTLFYINSFLLFILNESKEPFSQSSGILPFRADSLFVKMFKPTVLSFVFIIWNFECLDFKIWLRCKEIHSSEGSFELYFFYTWKLLQLTCSSTVANPPHLHFFILIFVFRNS